MNGLVHYVHGIVTSVKRFLIARFGLEAGLVLIARILQNANGFLLSVLVVRRFGLAAAGTLAISSVATVVIGLLGTFGLPYVMARTDAPIPVRNSIGFAAGLAVLPLSIPLVALLSLVAGRDPPEILEIAVLAMGGPFFAQTNVAGALQVLQGRAAHAIIAPLANLLGLVAGAIFGSSYLIFAMLLMLFRFGGTLIAFLALPRAPISASTFLRHISEGGRFLTADAMNLGADQLIVLISSYVMSRGDLGLLGLCRQMLTVSDTPGWSKVQACYPDVVAAPERALPDLRRLMLRLGALCGVVVTVLIVPVSLWVYHLPYLLLLVPLLMASSPIRYLLTVYDIHLRARGEVERSNRVSLARSVLALLIVPAASWAAGPIGAVLGIITQTMLATWMTWRTSLSVRTTPIGQAIPAERVPG